MGAVISLATSASASHGPRRSRAARQPVRRQRHERDRRHGREVSPAKDKLALIKGTNVEGDSANAVIQLYTVSSFNKPPTPACSFRPPGSGPFNGPSWSPDGSSITWSEKTGVWTSSVNLAASNCGVSPKLLARGGQAPDWSRASATQR